MLYLVDTDWVIHYFNRVGPVVDRIAELTPSGLGMSIISLAELYEGVLGASDPQRSEEEVQAFLERVDLRGAHHGLPGTAGSLARIEGLTVESV